MRAFGSSGGMVTWTAMELMRRGLIDAVAHVAATPSPDEGAPLFRYVISRSEASLRAGAKSRYYPIELSEVIKAIRFTPGRYAVVGLPCFIKAIHLLRAEDPVLRERVVFTLGLFCGHMKSARMVESFAWQMGEQIQAVDNIDFRAKDPSRPANWYTARIGLKTGGERRQDWWHFVDGDWGAGFFQNSACNFCDDVVAETADISFGDAWIEPYSSDGRGTNVVVIRSPVLDRIVRSAFAAGELCLKAVDADFVHQTQAAGFRQRREGLALRLSRRRFGVRPRKRIAPLPPRLSVRRLAVYLLRGQITYWSHRIFFLARLLNKPGLYTRWARTGLAVYQGFAYSRGKIGAAIDRLQAAAPSLSPRSKTSADLHD
ncbi:Coenzyme F420 hydrogenase/dehydrogenase, beta subunit C-terminal domain [Siccirubricoccus deserti]